MSQHSLIKSIHYLRGIAALVVVCFHFRYYLNDYYSHKTLGDLLFSKGAFGVDLFFIISGFIICYATQRSEARPLLAYTLKRVFRIYPLMLCCLLLYFFLFGAEQASLWLSMLPVHSDYSESGPFFGYNLLSPVWTLTYELLFYAVFLLGLSLSQRYRHVFAMVLLCSIFVLLQYTVHKQLSFEAYTHYDYPVPSVLVPVVAVLSSPMMLEFVAGMVLYLLFSSLPPLHLGPAMKIAAFPLLMLSFLLVLWAYWAPYFTGHGPTKWGIPAIWLIATGLLYERCYGLPNSRVLVFLGNVSFSLYLTHMLVIKAIQKYELGFGLDGVTGFLYALIASLVIAAVAYYLIEIRAIVACRKLLQRVGTKVPATRVTKRSLQRSYS